jgi:hypothetical protein
VPLSRFALRLHCQSVLPLRRQRQIVAGKRLCVSAMKCSLWEWCDGPLHRPASVGHLAGGWRICGYVCCDKQELSSFLSIVDNVTSHWMRGSVYVRGSGVRVMEQDTNPPQQLEELQRYVAWLERELARQRQMHSALRVAAAELARTFQASLVEVVRAADVEDIQAVRDTARATQAAWRTYLTHIIAASKRTPYGSASEPEKSDP